MNKKLIRLTESDLHRIVEESVNRIINESSINSLDDNDIMMLAELVVKKYGHGNCIDLSNPKSTVEMVKQVMGTENCDEFNALLYMSGAKGGGWG